MRTRLFQILLKALLVTLFLSTSLLVFAATVTIDSAIHTTVTSHHGSAPTVVFTGDQTGYAFYRDSTGACVYSKTPDGGDSWGAAVTVDAQTDCVKIAVWYDQWTPGDTGNFVHIATMDTGSSEIWYTSLNTSSDTLSSTVDVTGLLQNPTVTIGANLHAITKATDGTLYLGMADSTDSFVLRCSTTCTTALNWTEAGVSPFTNDEDWLLLMPLSGGDILAINWDISTNTIASKVFDGLAWDASWTTVDASAVENGTYSGTFGATVNLSTNDIYLAYTADTGTLGTDDDVRTAVYSSGAWTAKTDVLTNDTKGITSAKITRDENSGNLYAVYSARTSPGTGGSANVYYKVSSDNMSTWGSEQGPVNTSAGNFYGMRVNLSSDERLYATWSDSTVDDLFGNSLADLEVPVVTVSTSGTQTSAMSVPSDSNPSGGAFLLTRSAGTASVTVSSITITEGGTVSAQSNLSNLELYTESLSGSCTFDGSETLFGTAASFNASEKAAVTGSVTVSGTAICVYAVFNVGSGASGGETIEIGIADPSTEVVVSVGSVSPATAVNISGTTTLSTNQAPDTPSNVSPANGATVSTTLTPTLTASAFNDADLDGFDAAQWQVSTSASDFSSPVWDSGATTASSSTTVGTTLNNSTTYYWRVRYRDSFGLFSSYSAVTSFTISNGVPTAPTNVSPANLATVTSLTPFLQASAFSDAEGDDHAASQWQISTVSDFSSTVYDATSSSAEITRSVPSGTLDNLTTYYWRVRYKDDFVADHWSAYSSATAFTTAVSAVAVEINALFGKTSFSPGESVPLDAQVFNFSSGAPIGDATVTTTIFDPSGDIVVSDAAMTLIVGSNGIYRYSFTVPSELGIYLYEVEAVSGIQTGYASANLQVVDSDISSELADLSSALDVLVGAFIVSQATVNDSAASTSAFVTTLSSTTNDFYKNAVLTFTGGTLDGQSRRISAYNGSTKQVTVDPALSASPGNGDAFTVVAQNVRVEEVLTQHEAAESTFRTEVSSALDGLASQLTTIDANLLALQSSVNTIRSTQERSRRLQVSDVESVSKGAAYRVKLYLLDEDFLPVDADAIPTVTIYDSNRAVATGAVAMTPLLTGVYELVYTVPASATGGLWETVVNATVGGAALEQNDYWEVTGSPAQVLITSVNSAAPAQFLANVIITNEGSEGFEYSYEWCVVAEQSNACGGGDDVSFSSAAKFIEAGEDFITELPATVPDPGSYYFKVLVHFGDESSGASQLFTVTSSGEVSSSSSGSGSGGGSYFATGEGDEEEIESSEWEAMQDMLVLQSTQLEELLRMVSVMYGDMPGLLTMVESTESSVSSYKDIQNELSSLSAVSLTIRRLLEGASTQPIVETYMKFNSVELYFLITNPSSSQQTIEFKSYLPKGVTPEQIIDSSGLLVDYDFDPAVQAYYVHGTLLLGPNEVVNKKVEMKDVWIIDMETLFQIRNDAEQLAALLEGTIHESTAAVSLEKVEALVSEIIQIQEASYTSPQLHIAAYSDNMVRMEEAEAVLEELRTLAFQDSGSSGFVGSVLGIELSLINLALVILGVFMFFMAFALRLWHRQTLLIKTLLDKQTRRHV